VKLTPEEALALLPCKDEISVVESRKPGEVQASKWARETIVALIAEHAERLELAGQIGCAMGRGLVITRPSFHPSGNKLHVECDPDMLSEMMNQKGA